MTTPMAFSLVTYAVVEVARSVRVVSATWLHSYSVPPLNERFSLFRAPWNAAAMLESFCVEKAAPVFERVGEFDLFERLVAVFVAFYRGVVQGDEVFERWDERVLDVGFAVDVGGGERLRLVEVGGELLGEVDAALVHAQVVGEGELEVERGADHEILAHPRAVARGREALGRGGADFEVAIRAAGQPLALLPGDDLRLQQQARAVLDGDAEAERGFEAERGVEDLRRLRSSAR